MPIYPLIPTPTDGFPSPTSILQSQTEQSHLQFLLPWTQPEPQPVSCPTSDDDNKEEDNHSETTSEYEYSSDEEQRASKPQEPSSRSITTAVLHRQTHAKYLISHLTRLDEPHCIRFDSIRPLMLYHLIGSLSVLNYVLKPIDQQRAIETLLSFQHPQGGFAGQPGAPPHLVSTCSAILTLATLLRTADHQARQNTWARVNVTGMYNWILTLKTSENLFAMNANSESDIRACYCVLNVASLLNFLTPELSQGVPKAIAFCQTYEGGLASNLVHLPGLKDPVTLGEAHAGHTSCGLISHFLLKSVEDSVPFVPLNYDAALQWIVHMQAQPMDGAGFCGRTNKLVDGCYNMYCGRLFPILNALMPKKVDEELYDRQGIQEYTLLISQGQYPLRVPGGLRDKPDTTPDEYHTHCVLTALSSAQNLQRFSKSQFQFHAKRFDQCGEVPVIRGKEETLEQATQRCRAVYSHAHAWTIVKQKELVIGHPSNKVLPTHPVFNIPTQDVKGIMDHFYLKR